MSRCTHVLLLASALTLAACGSRPVLVTPIGFFAPFETCREEYAAIDARVAAAGVENPTYHRVPGFPYLRSDRLYASFADELDTPEKLFGWLRRMRELDQEAREFEYMNLGLSRQQAGELRHRLIGCGQTLAGLEMDVPSNLALVKARVSPPDQYSSLGRLLGGGPSATDIDARLQALGKAFQQPVEQLESPGPLTVLKVRATEDPAKLADGFSKTLPDEFGFPGLYESAWLALAERHAPILWIETASARDLPGQPLWREQGIDVDPARPTLYYSVSFSRFGTTPVVQILYQAWFRGVEGGPRIDGRVWRVTLDLNMTPIAYDSAHGSGRDHLWFPVKPLERRRNGDGLENAEAFVAPGSAPGSDVALRLAAGSHDLRRVLPGLQARGQQSGTYELERFEALYALPLPGGGTRNLFEADGHVVDSAQPAPGRGWGSGLPDPAPLMHFSRLPVSQTIKHHFDEPFLMDSVFVSPGRTVSQRPD